MIKTPAGAALTRAPSAPSWLSRDAKAEWKRALPGLVARSVITATDLANFENYCVAVGRVREIERALQVAFDLPLCRAQDKAIATSRQLATELGLTPISRSRAAIAGEGDDDASAYLD